jgi:hypothetical protein
MLDNNQVQLTRRERRSAADDLSVRPLLDL